MQSKQHSKLKYIHAIGCIEFPSDKFSRAIFVEHDRPICGHHITIKAQIGSLYMLYACT